MNDNLCETGRQLLEAFLESERFEDTLALVNHGLSCPTCRTIYDWNEDFPVVKKLG
jgi:hypothetical protein